MNPNINLIEAAPDLFFGSMLLSVSYFLFESIWAPIGVHFANNYFESVWGTDGESSLVFMVLCEIALVVIGIYLLYKRGRVQYHDGH